MKTRIELSKQITSTPTATEPPRISTYLDSRTSVFADTIRKLHTTEDCDSNGYQNQDDTNRILYFGIRSDGEPIFWLQSNGDPIVPYDDPHEFSNFLADLADNDGQEFPEPGSSHYVRHVEEGGYVFKTQVNILGDSLASDQSAWWLDLARQAEKSAIDTAVSQARVTVHMDSAWRDIYLDEDATDLEADQALDRLLDILVEEYGTVTIQVDDHSGNNQIEAVDAGGDDMPETVLTSINEIVADVLGDPQRWADAIS